MLPLLMRLGELALHTPVDRPPYRHWRGFLPGGNGPDVELVVVTTHRHLHGAALSAWRGADPEIVVGAWRDYVFAARPASRGVTLAAILDATRAADARFPVELTFDLARRCAATAVSLRSCSPGDVLIGWDGTIWCDGLDPRTATTHGWPTSPATTWAPLLAHVATGERDLRSLQELVERARRDTCPGLIADDRELDAMLARAVAALSATSLSRAERAALVAEALAHAPTFDSAPFAYGLFPHLWRADAAELAELSIAAGGALAPNAYAYGELADTSSETAPAADDVDDDEPLHVLFARAYAGSWRVILDAVRERVSAQSPRSP